MLIYASHTLAYHKRVTCAPGGDELVDILQQRQDLRWHLEDGLFFVPDYCNSEHLYHIDERKKGKERKMRMRERKLKNGREDSENENEREK